MVFALFNGSYMGQRNTGIGVVSKSLISSLSTDLVALLDPLNSGRKGSIAIPSDLSPEKGFKAHLKRLAWVERHVPKLLRDSGAHVLLSPLPEAPLFSPVRSVVLAHDLLPLRYPSSKSLLAYYSIYVPQVLHKAELILCNSEATARDLNQILNIPISKLVTIKLGFDSSSIYPRNLPREDYFLVLGRHNPHKNLERVLMAFSSLKLDNYRIVFVGPFDHRYTPHLKRIAKEHQILDKCIWINWISDKERLVYLNKCRCLIIASLWEGFGLPALEAMACGTPVIASNSGALPEVVGDVAILIDPLRHKSIANAMLEIIQSKKLQIDAHLSGPKQASNFNWKTTAKEVENILISL